MSEAKRPKWHTGKNLIHQHMLVREPASRRLQTLKGCRLLLKDGRASAVTSLT